MKKICIDCGIDISNRGYLSVRCKPCQKVYGKIAKKANAEKNKKKLHKYSVEYSKNNRQAIRDRAKKYYWEHKELIADKGKVYREKNKDKIQEYLLKSKDKIKDRERKYRQENKDIRNRKRREKYKNDMAYKIETNLRIRMIAVMKDIKNNTFSSTEKTREYLGLSLSKFKEYLEGLFTDNMSWDNYSYRGWHIDHIRPCASFDLNNEEERKQCFHYTNLQPLWAEDNYKKGSKIIS